MKVLSLLSRKIKTFFKIDFETKVMFIKAFILCGFYRFLILNIQFSKVNKLLGEKGIENGQNGTRDEYKIANKVAWIVKLASKHTPWESKCLVQAMTAQKLLKDKGVKTTLYLGVAKEGEEMIAHSWLRYGKVFVTGGNGDLKYARVSCFAN